MEAYALDMAKINMVSYIKIGPDTIHNKQLTEDYYQLRKTAILCIGQILGPSYKNLEF